MTNSDEHVELARIIDGRYVWDPVKSVVEYFLKGDRHSIKTLALHESSNTYGGAMRMVARDLLKTHPTQQRREAGE